MYETWRRNTQFAARDIRRTRGDEAARRAECGRLLKPESLVDDVQKRFATGKPTHVVDQHCQVPCGNNRRITGGVGRQYHIGKSQSGW